MTHQTTTQPGQIGASASRKTAKQRREAFLKELRDSAPESLKRMWAESKRNGTDKLSLREINAIIAEVRAESAPKH
jgi:hypothetical protein